MKQLVILAGGKGTRLKERLGNLPKSMIQISGQPIVEHQIKLAKNSGFERILILSNAEHDRVMRDYVGSGEKWGVNILHQIEHSPLGTACAVLSAFKYLDDSFIVMCGDLVVDTSLQRLAECHDKNQADVTIWVHRNDHPFDSTMVGLAEDQHVAIYLTPPHFFNGLASAGIFAMRKEAIKPWRDFEPPLDLANGLFPLMFLASCRLFGYQSDDFV